MSVRDGRKAKFHWQSPDEIEHIRYEWHATSPSAAVGLGVYRALTELATEDKARTNLASGGDSERFRTSQKEIAERAMVSDRSVAKACDELERIGLLAIETDRLGDNRPGRPSYYTLLDPPATYERSSHVGVVQRANGVLTTSEASSDVPAKGTNSVRTSLYKGRRKEKKEEEARVVETEKATTAWETAKGLLHQRLTPAKFDVLRELVAAGECGDCLILVDHSGVGVRDWRERAEPLILETVDGFDAVEILDVSELDESESLDEFDIWLADYHEVTGRTAMIGSDEARKSFAARRKEGRTVEELKLATRGAHGNDYLRDEALDRPETILRKSKHLRYIELGKKTTPTADGGQGQASEYNDLVKPAT